MQLRNKGGAVDTVWAARLAAASTATATYHSQCLCATEAGRPLNEPLKRFAGVAFDPEQIASALRGVSQGRGRLHRTGGERSR